jgi:hypothetical protein
VERVTFLIEGTPTRLVCLLNPEGLTIRRRAGIIPRSGPTGPISGTAMSDDPLYFSGGGVTELDFLLLFDASLTGSSVVTNDVRDLTSHFWRLSENTLADGRFGRPPTVRFMWGKGWNVPGVVIAAAERFEAFTDDGLPKRSWLRLRLRRTSEEPLAPPPPVELLEMPELPDVLEPPAASPALEGPEVQRIISREGERMDQLAQRALGDASIWRVLADFAGIDDPLSIAPGTELTIPDLGSGEEAAR